MLGEIALLVLGCVFIQMFSVLCAVRSVKSDLVVLKKACGINLRIYRKIAHRRIIKIYNQMLS